LRSGLEQTAHARKGAPHPIRNDDRRVGKTVDAVLGQRFHRTCDHRVRLARADGSTVVSHCRRPVVAGAPAPSCGSSGCFRCPEIRRTGAALRKGQIMRYLAEIPWAPDAILRNKTLAGNTPSSRGCLSEPLKQILSRAIWFQRPNARGVKAPERQKSTRPECLWQPNGPAKVHNWLGPIYRSAYMCDYSLHAVANRAAEVAETLITTKFRCSGTRESR
jgi:hypothetical protein